MGCLPLIWSHHYSFCGHAHIYQHLLRADDCQTRSLPPLLNHQYRRVVYGDVQVHACWQAGLEQHHPLASSCLHSYTCWHQLPKHQVCPQSRQNVPRTSRICDLHYLPKPSMSFLESANWLWRLPYPELHHGHGHFLHCCHLPSDWVAKNRSNTT